MTTMTMTTMEMETETQSNDDAGYGVYGIDWPEGAYNFHSESDEMILLDDDDSLIH